MSLQVHQLHGLPSSSCHLHPDELVTGFCASCLRERLADLDSAASGRKSASSSAFKSLFFKTAGGGQPTSSNSTSSSFSRPELRRCKSYSFGRGDGFFGPRASAAFELQRKSCDVRVRNTLWSLFHQDNSERDKNRVRDPFLPSASSSSSSASAAAGGEVEGECRTLRFPPSSSSVAAPVLETREEEEEEEEGRDNGDEIRVVNPVLVVGTSGEMEGGEREEADLKPMKDHIGFDSAAQAKKPPPKDLKDIAGSFWLAASVFSKKLQKWRRKQKLKKQQGGSKAAASAMPASEKPPRSSRRFRDAHSEIAIDAFGRRSCDTDPRFSLDAGRFSFDDPRFSWDEPRASWDGYLSGGRSLFPRLPPMLSVVEDVPTPAVQRSDGQIPVEEDAMTPGGSTETREYSDASSRWRRSFERSNPLRKATVETNEPQPASNAKASPASGTEFFPFHPGSLFDGDLRDFSSNSLRDDRSESFESAFRDSCKGSSTRKSRRWSKAWNIWGLIHRRGSSRGGDDVVRRSFSESWPELQARGYGGKISRCNSSVSWRSSFNGDGGGFGSMKRSSVETDGHGKRRREEIVLERSRSGRYSPSHFENGLLRFHLTPMRNSRRNGGSGKGKHISSHYLTRSVLGSH